MAPPTNVPGVRLVHYKDIVVKDRGRKELGDVEGLAASIKQFGLLNPLVIDAENRLIAGGRRYTACLLAGIDLIPCRDWGTLDPIEQRQIELEENLRRKDLTWDEVVSMQKELHELMVLKTPALPPDPTRGPGKPPLAWGTKETAKLLGISEARLSQDMALAEAVKEHPDLKEFASKTNAFRIMRQRREQALLIERASRALAQGKPQESKIEHGDCLSLLKKLKDSSIDLIITDPPWGIDLEFAGREWVREWKMFADNVQDARYVTQLALSESYRVLREGSHLYLFCAWSQLGHWTTFLIECGFWVRPSPVTWVKTTPTASQPYWMFMPRTECIVFAHKGQGGRSFTKPASDVLEYEAPRQRIHPTEKPIDLLRFLISISSVEGETVLDPFAGSGSTIRAATLSNRIGLGFEIDEEMCKKAQGLLWQIGDENAAQAGGSDESVKG